MIEFSIKGKKCAGEKVYEGELDLRKNSTGSVTVVMRDNNYPKHPWNLLTIHPDGTFERNTSLPNGIGLQLSNHAQIKERE